MSSHLPENVENTRDLAVFTALDVFALALRSYINENDPNNIDREPSMEGIQVVDVETFANWLRCGLEGIKTGKFNNSLPSLNILTYRLGEYQRNRYNTKLENMMNKLGADMGFLKILSGTFQLLNMLQSEIPSAGDNRDQLPVLRFWESLKGVRFASKLGLVGYMKHHVSELLRAYPSMYGCESVAEACFWLNAYKKGEIPSSGSFANQDRPISYMADLILYRLPQELQESDEV